jgi:hypothetical protein
LINVSKAPGKLLQKIKNFKMRNVLKEISDLDDIPAPIHGIFTSFIPAPHSSQIKIIAEQCFYQIRSNIGKIAP